MRASGKGIGAIAVAAFALAGGCRARDASPGETDRAADAQSRTSVPVDKPAEERAIRAVESR